MLFAHEVASALIRSLRAPIDIVARHDKSLADQLRRAASSVLLNVVEGQRRVGKDRQHFYRIAAGSAAEVRGVLEIAVAWGYTNDESITHTVALLDRELALLFGLTRRAK